MNEDLKRAEDALRKIADGGRIGKTVDAYFAAKEKPAPVEMPPAWEMMDNALRRGDRLMMEGDRLRKERDQALADLAKVKEERDTIKSAIQAFASNTMWVWGTTAKNIAGEK